MTFLAAWGRASVFFKDATKIQNGRQRSTPNFFVGAKTQGFTEIQNGCHGSTSIFCGRNFLWEQKLVRDFSRFTITFPTIWRCAGDFFKVLLKFKIVVMDQLKSKRGHVKTLETFRKGFQAQKYTYYEGICQYI